MASLPDGGESEQEHLHKNSKENLAIDGDSSQSVYQIRPQLEQKFKPQAVRELIHNVLYDQFASKTYQVDDAHVWCKTVADLIRNKVKDLNYRQYKYVVNVVVGEQKGAGIKMGSRCLWDVEADDSAHEHFTNETIFCVACVYAIFNY